MKNPKALLTSLAAAALLVACGGGSDKPEYVSVVSFGDSVSDAGTYKVGSVAALQGGKWTVNGGDDKTWTEVLAVALRVPAQCAARTGMTPNNGVTGAAITNIAACNNYAQGSSRVTFEGSGPNGVSLQAFGQANLGFMANSLQEQMTRHLAKVGGSFAGNELVTVNAGGNDAFMNLNGVASAAGGGVVAQGAAQIAGWPASVVAAVGAGGAPAANAAAQAAGVAMGAAGTELANYIKTLLVAKGAKYVVVRNLGNLNATPFGASLDAGTKGLITSITNAFNTSLKTGLNGTAGVLIYDDYAESDLIAANPAAYGFTNITARACGANAFGTPNGSSLVCNASNLIAGDTSRYAFADDVHVTPYAHRKIAEIVLSKMAAVSWY